MTSKQIVFGRVLPVLLGALLGLLFAPLLSGCEATPTAPVFVPQVYTCTVSGSLTSTDSTGSTSNPITRHPVTLDVPAGLVSLAAQPYPFTYGLTGKYDDGTVVRWRPMGLIGGGTAGTITPTSAIRFQYDLSPPQLRLDITETYSDGSVLQTQATGTCVVGGV